LRNGADERKAMMKNTLQPESGAMRRHAAVLVLGTGLCVFANTAQALLSCSVSNTSLNFGTYQSLTMAGKVTSVDVTSQADFTVECNGLLSLSGYKLALGPSSNGSGDKITTRYLPNITNGGDYMAFNVYTDSNRQTVWGDNTAGTMFTGNFALLLCLPCTVTKRVYGKIPAGQYTLKPGIFRDILTITLFYNVLL
jgi:spore coat protein U-like protein